MAITKTTTVDRIEVYPPILDTEPDISNDKHPYVFIVYKDILDDESDTDLPVTATRTKYLYKFVENGGAATDYSSEDALVQTVCAAIWS